MTDDELQTLRLLIREEVGTAVYASEQRLSERIDALDHRMDRLEAVQKQMQAELLELKLNYVEIKSTLAQAVNVLDEATSHIKEVRETQYMLERRMEERSGQLAHHVQGLTEILKEFTKEFGSIVRMLNERIAAHENLPFDKAHRRPGSAA